MPIEFGNKLTRSAATLLAAGSLAVSAEAPAALASSGHERQQNGIVYLPLQQVTANLDADLAQGATPHTFYGNVTVRTTHKPNASLHSKHHGRWYTFKLATPVLMSRVDFAKSQLDPNQAHEDDDNAYGIVTTDSDGSQHAKLWANGGSTKLTYEHFKVPESTQIPIPSGSGDIPSPIE